ncbi:unnamed protein product [Haemonchus placei]|uniref:Uncharacterized protein n=1 Tax=Haemonchus placei TaxID=6290 RepID=A0A0N4WLH9_HAEPC|nr:unnamed protein product [Haemonchus placei]
MVTVELLDDVAIVAARKTTTVVHDVNFLFRGRLITNGCVEMLGDASIGVFNTLLIKSLHKSNKLLRTRIFV